MKKTIEFLYPAIFIKDEDDGSFQVIFPDLNIYTDGKNLSEAYMNAKDLLTVYFTYAFKYETEFNMPSKFEQLASKCKSNETLMLINATIEPEKK